MMVPDTLRSSSCEDLCSNIHFHQTRPNRMIDGLTNMQKAQQSCKCPAAKCNERRFLANPSVCKYLKKKNTQSLTEDRWRIMTANLQPLVVVTFEASFFVLQALTLKNCILHNFGSTINVAVNSIMPKVFVEETLTVWHPLLLPRNFFFRPQACLCGTEVDKVALGHVYLQILGFPPLSIITLILHITLHSPLYHLCHITLATNSIVK